MPIPWLPLQKKDLSHAEKQRVWSQSCGLQEVWQCTDCAPMWLPQTELLATLGWKCGCQPFSCPCSQNVTHCRMEICSPCLLKSSIPTIPTRSLRLLRAAVCSTTSPLWLHHAHPFVAAAGKACLMQRSIGFSHGVVVSKIRYDALIGLSVVLSECCKPMNNCRDWAFSNSGLEVWVPAFHLPSLQNVTHRRMEICSPCVLKSSIPTILCGNSKPPFPTRSLRLLRAAVCSTTSPLWLHHAHPFVAAAEKKLVSCREAEWSRSCGFQDLFRITDCALSCAVWVLQTNEQLSRLSF